MNKNTATVPVSTLSTDIVDQEKLGDEESGDGEREHRHVHLHDDHGFVVDSSATQILGVAILEFGVILHRYALLIPLLRFERILTFGNFDFDDSVLIGLTLAVDEDFKVLFVVIVFHRTSLPFPLFPFTDVHPQKRSKA